LIAGQYRRSRKDGSGYPVPVALRRIRYNALTQKLFILDMEPPLEQVLIFTNKGRTRI